MHVSSGSRVTTSRAAFVIALISACIAVLLRWYFVTHAQVLQPLDMPNVRADAAEYYRYAWNILHHGVFSSAVPGAGTPPADSFRDPGYPVFLAVLMAVFPSYDAWYAAVLLGHAVLGGVTVASLVLAMRDVLPRWALAAMGLTAAAWPHSVAMASYVLSENLTAALVATALLGLRGAVTTPTTMRWAAAGVLFALAGLTNAVLAPLVIPLALVLLWKRATRRRHIAILAIAALLPLSAWAVRNTSVASDMSSSFRAEQNLVQGSWPIYHEAYQLASHHDPDGLRAMDEMAAETSLLHTNPSQGLKAMASRMAQRPGMYLAWYISKPALLWGWDIRIGQGDIYVYPTRNSPYAIAPAFKAMEGLAFLLNPLLAMIALVGLVLAMLRRGSPAVAMGLAVTAVWVTCVYGVLQSEPRYAIPFRGVEIALAAYALAWAVSWARDRRKRVTEEGNA